LYGAAALGLAGAAYYGSSYPYSYGSYPYSYGSYPYSYGSYGYDDCSPVRSGYAYYY
jgi:hypothetical protein